MTNFARNEIIPATKVVRQFATFLTQLKKHDVEKIGIVRNNEMVAVMVPIDEYENLIKNAKRKKSVKDYFGKLDEVSADEMELLVKDCRKVDLNEW